MVSISYKLSGTKKVYAVGTAARAWKRNVYFMLADKPTKARLCRLKYKANCRPGEPEWQKT
jgi:hypothetical protein